MSYTALMPFQPDQLSPGQLAAVNLDRHGVHFLTAYVADV